MAERLVQQELGRLAPRNIGTILGWVNQGGIAGWPKYYHPGSDQDLSVFIGLKVLLIDQLSMYAESLYE